MALQNRNAWTAKAAREAMRQAPVVGIEALCPPGPIAIVAPHPDDEALGCGGLMALAAALNRDIIVAFLTDGGGSHPASKLFPRDRLTRVRAEETRAACALLQGGPPAIYGFQARDGALAAAEDEAANWLGALFDAKGVTSAFVTWEADPHPDHKAAFRAAHRAALPRALALWCYPVWGLTLGDDRAAGPVRPCRRLDISPVVPLKAEAIAAYESQVGPLIADDPTGFRLAKADIQRHLGAYEIFLEILRLRP